MKRKELYLLAMIIAVPVQAATVIYTDSNHPPVNLPSNSQVFYLDAPETVQEKLFGVLPSDPHQAEQVALTIIQSPTWKVKEQQITQAYQGVLQAYSLQLKKYPAVVFDDLYVVYGTTDVALAQAKLADYQEAQ